MNGIFAGRENVPGAKKRSQIFYLVEEMAEGLCGGFGYDVNSGQERWEPLLYMPVFCGRASKAGGKHIGCFIKSKSLIIMNK